MGEHDIVLPHLFVEQALRDGRDFLIAFNGIGRGKRSDEIGIATFEIPEIVQVAVGEKNEATVQRTGVPARLLLADRRVPVLRLGLQNDEGKSPGVEQEKVDKSPGDLLEIVAQGIEIEGFDGDTRFKADIGGLVPFGKETPSGRFEQLVDLYSRRSFTHAISLYWVSDHQEFRTSGRLH